MSMLSVGVRVLVDDPSWHKHGAAGVVTKVNRRTVRVRLDGEPTDVVGAACYFAPEPARLPGLEGCATRGRVL